MNSSRAWGALSRDFINDSEKSKKLIYRHLAWLTVLRYEMRGYRVWEALHKTHNIEYTQYYSIPEQKTTLKEELSKYLDDKELSHVLATKNKATQILSMQSKTLKELYDNQEIVVLQFVDM